MSHYIEKVTVSLENLISELARNYFCEFSCLFFCAQRCYNQGNYYKRNSFQKEMILCRIKI